MPDTELFVEDFERFFAELWTPPGASTLVTPFPWQSELVRQIDHEHEWPDLVDLPTGTGKTSLLDIAVFLLALDAGRPAPERWMPRRVVLVVDRRVVVDQADVRGRKIAYDLEHPAGDLLGAVATRLRSLSGNGPALVTTVLRGGIVRDERWARRPDVPALISSTVDQVGSRLLFRGYGITPRMRPVHAGLLANDVLFLLDEVHLARPFAETLAAVARHRRSRSDDDHPLPDRWKVVELTATPTVGFERAFPAEPLDPGSHPVLARRLLARKPARLEILKVPKDDERANEQFAVGCVKLARDLLAEPHLRTVGVIVNRVDTARRIARKLADTDGGPTVVLLTGRMRSLDKDRILSTWRSRLVTGRERRDDDEALVVVATQSIEAGADFDLDGIVTECASLDALRQRFGRVDRDGRLSEASSPSMSVVAVRSTDLADGAVDPVYGEALANTWMWLSGLDVVDFGIQALAPPAVGEPELGTLVPPNPHAPVLLPLHLDRWVQTSQRSADSEPDVAAWLHGLEDSERVPDVQLVWRADLDVSLFSPEAHQAHREIVDEVKARVEACPPLSGESLGVTIGDFRRWAHGSQVDPTTSDVPGREDPTEFARDDGPTLLYLRWSGEGGVFVKASRIRPGDTVVVPATMGGLWRKNWDPNAKKAVTDLASIGSAEQRGRAVARLSPALFQMAPDELDPRQLEHETMVERRQIVAAFLSRLTAQAEDGVEAAVLRHLAKAEKKLRLRAFAERVDGTEVKRSFVVTTTERVKVSGVRSRDGGDLAPDDRGDMLSFTGVSQVVTLTAHLGGVADGVEQLARNLGLPPALVDDLRLAGALHDLGKVDSRFQRRLQGGETLVTDEILAKSPVPDTDAVARRRANELSGYPKGARHELLSLAMATDPPGPLATANDSVLVRHLIASHHGFGRYRFEPSTDLEPEVAAFRLGEHELSSPTDHLLHDLGSGVSDDFWQLIRRYGWFGMTWLESILRLADHVRSRAEQQGTVDGSDKADEVTS